MDNDITVWIYTLCYNEIRIIPFVLKYWKEYATRVIVYDNGSTDGSIEELSKYDWIEIRHFNQPDGINEHIYCDIKNNCWKEARHQNVDFVQVCDIDEVLWAPNMRKELTEFKQSAGTIWSSNGYELCTKKFPDNQQIFCHETDGAVCTSVEKMQKKILFKPSQLSEIEYQPGAHKCRPTGNVNYYDNTNIKLLHLKMLSPEYLIEKYHRSGKRLSALNKRSGWGFEYEYADDRIVEEFNKCYNAGQPIEPLKANQPNSQSKPILYMREGDQLGNIMFTTSAGKYYADTHGMDLVMHITGEKEWNRYVNEIFTGFNTTYGQPANIPVLKEPGATIYMPIECNGNTAYIDGYRQSPLYFNNDVNWCKQLFKPSQRVCSAIQKKFKDVDLSEYTSIHVRRQDYLSFKTIFHILTIGDYLKMMRRSGESKFIIFSDDMTWCKQQFGAITEFESILYATDFPTDGSVRDDIIDMYSMTLCKNNIISNSTFSWWGAYLNVHDERKVYHMSPWFQPTYQKEGDIIPKDIHWIDCSK